MNAAETFEVKHRILGALRVKHVRTQPSGMVRVEVVEGENAGCSFVILPAEYAKAIAA